MNIFKKLNINIEEKKLSYSRCKHLIKSINEYILNLVEPKPPTPQMVVGSLYETLLFEGEKAVFEKFYITPDLPDFPKKTKDQPLTVKEQKDSWLAEQALLNEGKQEIDNEMLAKVQNMVEVFKGHPLAPRILNVWTQKHEIQKKLEWRMHNENFIGFIDYYSQAENDIITPAGNKVLSKNEWYFVDLKKISSIDQADRQINEYKYYLQNFMYKLALFSLYPQFREEKNGKFLPKPINSFYIFQEEKAPYDITIKILDQTYDEVAMNELSLAINRFKQLKRNPNCYKGSNVEPEVVSPWAKMKKDLNFVDIEKGIDSESIYKRNPTVKENLTVQDGKIPPTGQEKKTITPEALPEKDKYEKPAIIEEKPFKKESNPFEEERKKETEKGIDPEAGLFQKAKNKTDEELIKEIAKDLFKTEWMFKLNQVIRGLTDDESIDLTELGELHLETKIEIYDELKAMQKELNK